MQKLHDIGFNFRVHIDKWSEHYEQLLAYKEKTGNCMVPTHYIENPKLGRWVHTQRHQRRLMLKGKKSSMTQERVEQLDKLGFSWEVRPSLERPRATWSQRFNELYDFYKEHGNFLISADEYPRLHSWCHEQKHRLKNVAKNDGKDVSKRMGPERVMALEKIGFTKDVELLALVNTDKSSSSPSHELGLRESMSESEDMDEDDFHDHDDDYDDEDDHHHPCDQNPLKEEEETAAATIFQIPLAENKNETTGATMMPKVQDVSTDTVADGDIRADESMLAETAPLDITHTIVEHPHDDSVRTADV